MALYSIISGTGSCIPSRSIPNDAFLDHQFYQPDGKLFERPTSEIIQKFEEITGITERRCADEDLVTSDLGYLAAKDALESSGIDPETLDSIIVAHNFGDVRFDNRKSDFVPSLAARVKAKLRIENPGTIAYDLPFGCPGWLQGVIQADSCLRSGSARRIMVIGAETMSRVADPHDRDGMIYADGAGATILESVSSEEPVGILSQAVRSDTIKHAYMLWMGRSYNPDYPSDELFLKMHGHKLYEYALRKVPPVVKDCMDKAGVALADVKKVFLHQANAKMDDAILSRVFRLFGEKTALAEVMPMTISWLGNSSVATVPTLYDLVIKGKVDNHQVKKGDTLIFASVGAGMNINAVSYRVP